MTDSMRVQIEQQQPYRQTTERTWPDILQVHKHVDKQVWWQLHQQITERIRWHIRELVSRQTLG